MVIIISLLQKCDEKYTAAKKIPFLSHTPTQQMTDKRKFTTGGTLVQEQGVRMCLA